MFLAWVSHVWIGIRGYQASCPPLVVVPPSFSGDQILRSGEIGWGTKKSCLGRSFSSVKLSFSVLTPKKIACGAHFVRQNISFTTYNIQKFRLRRATEGEIFLLLYTHAIFSLMVLYTGKKGRRRRDFLVFKAISVHFLRVF